VLAKLASAEHEGSGVSREGIEEMKTHMGSASVWDDFFPRFYGAAQTVMSLPHCREVTRTYAEVACT
jgi:hypothetical protein